MRVEDSFFRKPVTKPSIHRRKKTDKSFAELLVEESDVLTRTHPEPENHPEPDKRPADNRPEDNHSIDLTA
ncbi:hypothetical protein UZ36_02755 [Candidatus Nitromaritima sp. SCGC AAA799-C22]|nr:hypothetical protein UZ36_02755 [Candidatus Nitromaritima sp. SCGC AAA799-C22]